MSSTQSAADYEKEWRSKECAICLESVVEKGDWFGLLNTCDHTYCYQCIRHLSKYSKVTRTPFCCVYCQQKIDNWCPSVLPLTGEERMELLESDEEEPGLLQALYKERDITTIPCPFLVCSQKIELSNGGIACEHTIYNPKKRLEELRASRKNLKCTNCDCSIVSKGDWFGQLECCGGELCFDCSKGTIDNEKCKKCASEPVNLTPLLLTGKGSTTSLQSRPVACFHSTCFADKNYRPKFQPCPLKECKTQIEFKQGHFICKHGYCEVDMASSFSGIFEIIEQ